MNELKDSGHKERAPYNFAQPRAERLAGTPLQRRDKADDTQHPLPHVGTSGPGAHNVPGEAQGITQKLQCQAEASKATSRSATPFSWSESEPSRTQLERAVDHRLLEILHTGLSSVQNPDLDNSKLSQKKYCDFQELKALLDDRKAHWQTEVNSSISACLHEKASAASVDEEKNAVMPLNLTPEVNPRDESELLLDQSLLGEDHNRPQSQQVLDDYDRMVPIASSYQDRKLSQLHDATVMTEAEVDDDEAFFRKLDEAFHEIMDPGCKETDLMGGRPAGKATSLHRRSVASLLSDQFGFEIPHLGPSPVVRHSGEEPATRPNRHLESREFSYAPSHQGRPEQDVDDRATGVVPKGFWRQNRLY